ncbi:MAG: fasciclin domain-containing protein [Candidatus Sumerlaeia bacterium]|nr:fasciclin domain-containing protein [Candidatus Sumerlaeia bacterium]
MFAITGKFAAIASATLIGAAMLLTTTTATAYGPSSDREDKSSSYKEKNADIVDTAVKAGSFTTLAALLGEADLVHALKGDGPFTVFAPTDEAFKAVPKEVLEHLAANPDELKKVLTYHVVAGKYDAAKVLAAENGLRTLQGHRISFSVRDDKAYANDARISKTDIMASNGIIHVIDSVILPPDGPSNNIVETAVAAGNFTTLAALLTSTGLHETLAGEGPFTVFAPTDAAFEKIPAETLAALGSDREALTAVLLYHVVPGKVTAEDVAKVSEATTVQGSKINVRTYGENVRINDARVTAADVMASNGVIHVIDTVILPPSGE